MPPPPGVWRPGEPPASWQSGWVVVHSLDPGDLRVHGAFADEASMWREVEGLPLGQSGTVVYVAIPVTGTQLDRLTGPAPDLASLAGLVRDVREECAGTVRLAMVAPGSHPLWLGEAPTG